MKRRLSDNHDSQDPLNSTVVAKCRRIQRADGTGASPPPSNPSSQTLDPAEAPPSTAAAQDKRILQWLDSCDASPEPSPAIETMAAPPTPRSAATQNPSDGQRRAARRSVRARTHTLRTPSPSKKPTPQSYRRGNMRYASVYVDHLDHLPPAVDVEVRRIFGLQSLAELAQPHTQANTQPETQARLAALAATYKAESRLNARECSLEGNWKGSIFSLMRNLALLAPGTLCLNMSEKAWIPDLKPAAPSLDGLQEAGEEGNSGLRDPSAAPTPIVSGLVDFNSPAAAAVTAVGPNTSFPGDIPSLAPSIYSSTYSQSITTTTSLNASDPFHISTPKPDITVGLEETNFSLLHQRRLVHHQQSGTVLSDPHAAFMGMRFPFLIVETKGLSVNGNLVSAQNQAAIGGACMLRILKDLDETTDSHPTSPPLCFSIVTEGPAHELWIHFEHEGAFHMEALKSWRMTRANDVDELVRALAGIMEWGRGTFRAGVVARLDSQPGTMSDEHTGR
ncbi:uncharacterized protein EKO05_0003192 [Ascochyta rabiei]|uniref:uncharacterized protein n=1 Tax=Didymella rabiei TaxID=5454 RepID=UPI001900CEB4|nr:uncharacterized protein EKO05_0003192 [Ascochyta rabiei]UPX12651.1 hypothetical protein EKO05_0003192 [Ascochyta rabiei]